MNSYTGRDEEVRKKTWQAEWEETIDCPSCSDGGREPGEGTAYLVLVAIEEHGEETDHTMVCDNVPEGVDPRESSDIWPHDAMAVAIYFCPKCANTTALWNQA